jgi:hypothetical protein
MRDVPCGRLASQRSSRSTLSLDRLSKQSSEAELVDISPSVTVSAVPDLLTDVTPTLETAVIEPSALNKTVDVLADVEEESPDTQVTTVRLVGSSAIAGPVDAPSQ